MRNVVFYRLKKFRAHSDGILISAVFGFLLTGCTATRESICQEFPAISGEIDGLQIQIAGLDPKPDPKRTGKGGRKLASVIAPMPSPEEIRAKREVWMEWGAKALKRTQWAKDTLESDRWGRKAVPALNDAGLSLVSFHGYLEQAKWKKAGAELERVELSYRRARMLACEVQPAAKGKGRKK